MIINKKSLFGLVFLTGAVYASPEGGAFVAGEGKIEHHSAGTVKITAGSRAVIDWKSFSIGSDEKVVVLQPSARSALLNRVTGADPSEILGRIDASGALYLVNPNGIVFGHSAIINAASFVASTLDTSNDHFMLGREIDFIGKSEAPIINLGLIKAKDGIVALFAHKVENRGEIEGVSGAFLAAGHQVLLQPEGKSYIYIKPSTGGDGVENFGSVSAQRIQLLAQSDLYKMGIRQSGSLDAMKVVREGGEIFLRSDGGRIQIDPNGIIAAEQGTVSIQALNAPVHNAGMIFNRGGEIKISLTGSRDGEEGTKPFHNTGLIDVSHIEPGSITLRAPKFFSAGQMKAESPSGNGGIISIETSAGHIETASSILSAAAAGIGGQISISGSSYFTSGQVHASGKTGGTIEINAATLKLAAANIQAEGQASGGKIWIGNASADIDINHHSRVSASSQTGKGELLLMAAQGNLKGPILGAVFPTPAQANCFCSHFEFLDPNPMAAASSAFGDGATTALANGNVVITNTTDNFNAVNGGAVYLYNGANGALISALQGESANDFVGFGGVTALASGNFVVSSPSWSNPVGPVNDVGAVTFCSGTTGLNGLVSTSNSLTGQTLMDTVGSQGVFALPNGHYVVVSSLWDDPIGPKANAGAATWMNGFTGQDLTGAGPGVLVSSTNSLSGAAASDFVGFPANFTSVIVLNNSNYVVLSPFWSGGIGAATWASGNGTISSGPVTAVNSIIGSLATDNVGFGGIALNNGDYVIVSPTWTNPTGPFLNAGAATWADGTVSSSFTVGVANSIVGDHANDYIGSDSALNDTNVTALNHPSANYVVFSPEWNGTLGASTWARGHLPTSLVVGPTNSLVGAMAGDFVGTSVTALVGNNYVVGSPQWTDGANANAGAATWSDGGTGLPVGLITHANSLYGPQAGDRIALGGTVPGGPLTAVTPLVNGNYVVNSPQWQNGANTNAGAVTWGNGSTGTIGAVTAANSLHGVSMGDNLGGLASVALTNGHYVAIAPGFSNGIIAGIGAVVRCNGTNGSTIGPVTLANSLHGTLAGDTVGNAGVRALANGNYVVISNNWNNNLTGLTSVGAITWGNGNVAGGTTGAVSYLTNSVVGGHNGDNVGHFGFLSFPNSNYVVGSIGWDTSTGALTIGNGTTGRYCGGYGTVGTNNSITGSNTFAGGPGNFVADLVNGNVIFQFGDDSGLSRVFAASFGTCVPPPLPLPHVPSHGVHEYLIAISEAFQRWTATSWGAFLDLDRYPPDWTAKDLLLLPPSLTQRGIHRAQPMTYFQRD